MTWDRGAGTAPKYRSREHRQARAAALRDLKRLGSVECAQPVCVMPSRTIRHGDPTHLGHDDSGTMLIGLVHPECNVKDAAVRARAKQLGRDDDGWVM